MNFCSEHGNKDISKILYDSFLKERVIQDGQSILDTSLHFAIKSGKEDTVSFLISKKANVNHKIEGLLPIELAIKMGHTQILETLQKNKSLQRKKVDLEDDNLIHFAVRSGKAEMIWNVINKLDKHDQEKNQQTRLDMLKGKEKLKGNTPLHDACESHLLKENIEDLVGKYVEMGINISDLKNHENQSPLHLASKKGHLFHVEALLGIEKEILENKVVVEEDLNSAQVSLLNSLDMDKNQALHTAAEYDKDRVFQFLLKLSKDYKPVNNYGKTPLHIIAEFGAEKCLTVLDLHVANVNQEKGIKKVINVNNKDFQGNTPLHLAARKGHNVLVRKLLKVGGDVTILDQKGINSLQIAIDNRQESTVRAIIESDSWKEALRFGFRRQIDLQNVLDTPMRQLIRFFPEVAEIVLEKCIQKDQTNQKEVISYNFEFLEDTFKFKLEEENKEKVYKHVSEIKSKYGKDKNGDFIQPYTYSGKTNLVMDLFTAGDLFVENHPLMTINEYKQQNLLNNEVTKKLINEKWNSFGKLFYYANFFFYLGFLTALTVYINTGVDLSPQLYPNFYTCSPYFNESNFANKNQTYLLPDDALHRTGPTKTSRAFIWFFAAYRLVALLLGHEKKSIISFVEKLCLLLRGPFLFLYSFCKYHSEKYVKSVLHKMKPNNLFNFLLKQEWAFIFDITVYVFAVIIDFHGYYLPVLMDGTKLDLYLRPCWAWQLSAVTITLAWINLLSYMRQMPLIGHYIIVLSDIIYTFLQFIFILLVFLIAFTFGFQVLLYGKGGPFKTFSEAFLKTVILMSGEFDYGSFFYPDGEIYPEDASSPYYPDLIYTFFMLFLILVSIILTNLLVLVLLLFVSDVKLFIEVAKVRQLSNRLKFVLNMERFLNSWMINLFRKIIPTLFSQFRAKKIRNKVNIKELYNDDHKSKMWREVIATNVQEEDRENESFSIEETLQEMEDRVKNYNEKNTEKLEKCLEKEFENKNVEVSRTINFMTYLNNKFNFLSEKIENYQVTPTVEVNKIERSMIEMKKDIDHVKNDMKYIKNMLHQLLQQKEVKKLEDTKHKIGHDPLSIEI